MNAALRRVREIKTKLDGVNESRRKIFWMEEDGRITKGMFGEPVTPEELEEPHIIFTWDWEGTSEPPIQQDLR